MESTMLRKLNFETLLTFPEHFPVQSLEAKCRYTRPRRCTSFCIDCEQKGLCSSMFPHRMSHGADTEDIEQGLGRALPQPPSGRFVDTPVLFVGIEPGGEYGGGEILAHPDSPDIKKWVPTKHYYWTAEASGTWPAEARGVKWVPGPFLAHIVCRYGLRRAYFTNIVKCRMRVGELEVDIRPDKRHRYEDSAIRRNCVERYLRREVEIHQPAVVFVFGNRGRDILADEDWLDQELVVTLYHYAVVNRNLMTAQGYAERFGDVIGTELGRRGIIYQTNAVDVQGSGARGSLIARRAEKQLTRRQAVVDGNRGW